MYDRKLKIIKSVYKKVFKDISVRENIYEKILNYWNITDNRGKQI